MYRPEIGISREARNWMLILERKDTPIRSSITPRRYMVVRPAMANMYCTNVDSLWPTNSVCSPSKSIIHATIAAPTLITMIGKSDTPPRRGTVRLLLSLRRGGRFRSFFTLTIRMRGIIYMAKA